MSIIQGLPHMPDKPKGHGFCMWSYSKFSTLELSHSANFLKIFSKFLME